MGLHSLLYCERLFYLEEVEGLLVANDRVYAGRTLHEEQRPASKPETDRVETFEYVSETLGLAGKVDRVMKRDGDWIAYEHKRGRARTDGDEKTAWDSDLVQVTAYALLIEEATGRPVDEGRVRYHASNATVRFSIDAELKDRARQAIARAQELARTTERPPIAENENLCKYCSLAPVCLPEENRVITEPEHRPLRLFPEKRERATVHVIGHSTRVRKSAESLVVEKFEDENEKPTIEKVPAHTIESVNLHGNCQISTQTIHFLARQEIPLHWFSTSGEYVGGLHFSTAGGPQRRIRQFQALSDDHVRLRLARKLVHAKCETHLRYLLRLARNRGSDDVRVRDAVASMRGTIGKISTAESADVLLGFEGSVARAYYSVLPALLHADVPDDLRPDGRSKRPPLDRFNAALSFLYSMLYRSVHQAILAVGLDPAFGFYHTPRSAAQPLALDLMELFRTTLCDMPLLGSVNRLSWDGDTDFTVVPGKVWLSDSGRKKAVRLFETRLDDTWKHPVIGYSLSYFRMIELEVRLLEKEWTDGTELFARARLR